MCNDLASHALGADAPGAPWEGGARREDVVLREDAARRRDGVSRARGRACAAGFSLVELLLVMVLLGIVMGVGLGSFASFDPGRSAARGLVANALRQTRNTAIERGAPARVLIDHSRMAVRTEAFTVAGTWRFEDQTLAGARGVNGIADGFPGAFLANDGYVGKALDLNLGSRGAKVQIDLSSDPIFNVAKGFRLSATLRPEDFVDADVVNLGKVVRIKARSDGAVAFELTTQRDDGLGQPVKGETITLQSGGGVLEPGHWTQIELRYDRRRVVALADGVPVAERAESRPIWRLEGGLVLGGGRRRFAGCVDDLVLSVITTGDEVVLPKSAEFLANGPKEVRFDESGALDPVFHAGPVAIELLFDDSLKEMITVRALGTVDA